MASISEMTLEVMKTLGYHVNPCELIEYNKKCYRPNQKCFNNFEYEAECIVNHYTFNRLKDEKYEDYPDELGYCMYRLVELLKLQADAMLLGKQTITTTDGSGNVTTTSTSAPIRSQSNDGVSTSYNSLDASDLFKQFTSTGKDNPLSQIVFRYLQGVRNSKGKRLTYRGLYPDE